MPKKLCFKLLMLVCLAIIVKIRLKTKIWSSFKSHSYLGFTMRICMFLFFFRYWRTYFSMRCKNIICFLYELYFVNFFFLYKIFLSFKKEFKMYALLLNLFFYCFESNYSKYHTIFEFVLRSLRLLNRFDNFRELMR